MRLRASQPSSSLPHWKGAKSNLNKVSIKGFEREGDPLPPPLPVLSPHQLTTRCIQPPLANHPPNHESNSTPIPLQIHSVQIKTNSTKEEASSDDFFIQNREPVSRNFTLRFMLGYIQATPSNRQLGQKIGNLHEKFFIDNF